MNENCPDCGEPMGYDYSTKRLCCSRFEDPCDLSRFFSSPESVSLPPVTEENVGPFDPTDPDNFDFDADGNATRKVS